MTLKNQCKNLLKAGFIIKKLINRYGFARFFYKSIFYFFKPSQFIHKLKDFSNDEIYKNYISYTSDRLIKNKNQIINELSQFKIKPKITVLLPIHNSNLGFLHKAIESVTNQLYQNWELCIVYDISLDNSAIKTIRSFHVKDKRIKVFNKKVYRYISDALNDAFKISTGDYVTFFSQEDLLSIDALFYIVKLINKNKNLKFIYTDEDKLDQMGNRYDPYFKPDWSPDLLLSYNYISHLSVVRRETFCDIGGFRKKFDGAQDYDLYLRITGSLDNNQIGHIPQVLYHSRLLSKNIDNDSYIKSYALNVGLQSIKSYLRNKKIKASAEITKFNKYRIRYYLENYPLVSLIIPTKNGYKFLKKCIKSILKKTDYPNYEIIIVDNGSDESDIKNYFETIRKYKNIKIITDPSPFNYSLLNNRAVKHASGEIIGLINNDVEVISRSWLKEMVSYAVQSDVGAVGAKLLYPNNTIQHAGVITGIGGVAGHPHKHFKNKNQGYFSRAVVVQNLSAVTAACLVMKKDLFLSIGGFNEKFLKVAFNDVDICLRLRKRGYKILWTPFAELYHYESATRGPDRDSKKIKRLNKETEYMQKKWGKSLNNDPFYNKNLTLIKEDFSICWPPRF
jgi:GT2 family glycosyltransferase